MSYVKVRIKNQFNKSNTNALTISLIHKSKKLIISVFVEIYQVCSLN